MRERNLKVKEIWLNEVKPFYKKEMVAKKAQVSSVAVFTDILRGYGTEENIDKIEKALKELAAYAQQK